MNILPKKSWHVLNKDNIARVRRDEAQARAEEEEKASRAAIAEQESRLGAMRKRAREKDSVEEEEEERGGRRERGRKEKREECSVTDASGHINFFTDLQKGIGLQVGNVEREKEMKQEQEKLEKRIGLLNYLVDKDKSDNVPWYIKSGGGGAGVEEGRKSAKAEARKELQDPLLDMRGHLEAKRKREEMVGVVGGVVSGAGAVQGTSHSSQRGRLSSGKSEGYREGTSSDDRHSEKHKSHGHKKKKSKREEKEKKEEEKKKKKGERDDEIEKLRRERRKREDAERTRSEALIRGLQGGGGNSLSQPEAVEKGSGRYNSQFNPHLARQQ